MFIETRSGGYINKSIVKEIFIRHDKEDSEYYVVANTHIGDMYLSGPYETHDEAEAALNDLVMQINMT